ncbi:MAG: response regulator [Gammaproteobacteria bacterium]|nr:response regulator [Gammaproteobacteria bacterium]
MKILIAEDDENSRLLLETALTAQGYTVESSSNGQDALALAEKSPPSLIISDILMPQMDGFELCRHIKGNPKLQHTPFIFYSATFVESLDERLALALGATRLIVKPIEMWILLGIIKETLELADTERLNSPPTESDEQRIENLYAERLSRKLTKKVKELEWEREILMQSEERYRSLINDALNISSIAIIILDSKYKVTWFNQTLEEYFDIHLSQTIGLPAEQFYTEKIKDSFEHTDCLLEIKNSITRRNHIKHLECLLKPDHNSEARWLEYNSKPIHSGLYKGGRIEHFTDITRYKQIV